ncbi:hypothetical protein RJT34_23363 [Clitoria ternatea]|uniref:Uncharacterized protein n=1 Tax=Clitoria ternatea TaxID=43366 RepID=A0AAN9IIC6_CLITE
MCLHIHAMLSLSLTKIMQRKMIYGVLPVEGFKLHKKVIVLYILGISEWVLQWLVHCFLVNGSSLVNSLIPALRFHSLRLLSCLQCQFVGLKLEYRNKSAFSTTTKRICVYINDISKVEIHYSKVDQILPEKQKY